MTRPRHDRLLAALIARLPAQATPWPRADRTAWLQMMAMAFDVVYGPCGAIRIASDDAHGSACSIGNGGCNVAAPCQADHRAAPVASPVLAAASAARRFYVDRDGFAMGDGRPVAIDDLPDGAILWDERVGIECGDVSAILWRDTGASRASLPPGVTLRPMFDES